MAQLIKSSRLRKLEHGFTIVDNDIMFDSDLSLKGLGMLVRLISLPEGWTFSVVGLAKLCRDGKDSVRSALNELEGLGYIARGQRRDAVGALSEAVYMVFDERVDPQDAVAEIMAQGCMPITKVDRQGDRKEADGVGLAGDGFPVTGESADGGNAKMTFSQVDANVSNVVGVGFPDDGFPDDGFPDDGGPDGGNDDAAYISETVRMNTYDHDNNNARVRETAVRPRSEREAADYMRGVARELGVEIDPEECARDFVRYNEMRGWMLKNGAPIKDWRAAAEQWVSMEPQMSSKRLSRPDARSRQRPRRERATATQMPAGAYEDTGGFAVPEGMRLLEVIGDGDENQAVESVWRR